MSPHPRPPLQKKAKAKPRPKVKFKDNLPAKTEPSSTDRHFFASAYYSTANRVNYKGMINLFGQPTPFTASEATNTAPGVGGGYIFRRPNSFGFSGELAFDFVRHSNGLIGNAGSFSVHGTYSDNGGSNLWSAATNLNYSFGSDFYVYLGPNFPLTFLSKSTDNMHGLIGYQAGVGYCITPSFSVEGGYRDVRMKGTLSDPSFPLQIDEAATAGFILGVKYSF